MLIMNIEFDDARALVAMVEGGSISQAACDLHLTQPVVTRRIQRLEQAIGAALVDRRKRPFTLTSAGEAAVEHCRRLLSVADEMKSIALGAKTPTREMRIGVAHALTELALFEPIEELRRKFPALILRLYTGWSRDLTARVKNGAVDAAVILLPEDELLPASVEGTALAREELAIIAPRQWRSRRWSLARLAEENWVLNPEGCAARAWLQREFAKAGFPLHVGVEAYSYDLQMSLVARGQGLGLVPARQLARCAAKAQLATLPARGLHRAMTIWLLSHDTPAPLKAPLKTLGAALSERL
jgi:DNA-binding transcriptional LysR family regulator